MIWPPPPFWSPPTVDRPKPLMKPPFNWKKWALAALVMFIADNNMIWWFYWEKAQHQVHVRVVRVYTASQGPCIPP